MSIGCHGFGAAQVSRHTQDEGRGRRHGDLWRETSKQGQAPRAPNPCRMAEESDKLISELHARRRGIMAQELKAYLSPPQGTGLWAAIGAQTVAGRGRVGSPARSCHSLAPAIAILDHLRPSLSWGCFFLQEHNRPSKNRVASPDGGASTVTVRGVTSVT